MEQLELFPNQDYEDALAWLTEGLKGAEYPPLYFDGAISDYKKSRLHSEVANRATYFYTAICALGDWS